MDPGKSSSQLHLLCTERLESRWLLSGADADAYDDADEDRDVDVSTSDLPEPVLAALASRYPDATLLEAELNDNEGPDGLIYEVDAEVDGRSFEVLVSSEGTILNDTPEPLPISQVETPPVPAPSISKRQDVSDVAPSEAAPSEGAPSEVAPTESPVRLIEWEFADEGDSGEELSIPLSEIPNRVLRAFAALFPGANPTAAEYAIDDGEPEFDVLAEYRGETIDVTFTPQGELIETEQALTSVDLPQEVLDWVRQQFGDVEVENAAVVSEDGDVHYEVEIADATDGRDIEATLSVPGASAPLAPGGTGETPDTATEQDSITVPPQRALSSTSDRATEDPAATDVETAAGEMTGDAGTESAPSANVEAARVAAQIASNERESNDGVEVSRGAFLGSNFELAHVADAFRILLPGAAPTTWVPTLAGLIEEVLPLDVATIEGRMEQVLREIESLADLVVGEETGQAAFVKRLALVAALFAATQVALLNARRARGGPTLVFNASESTWSWVLGTPARTRTHARRTRDKAGVP